MSVSTVVLEEYSQEWLQWYQKEEGKIQRATGDWIKEIAHIGSTSIPNLKSKPIIDIMAKIEGLEDLDNITEPLKNVGYEYIHKPELAGRVFFLKREHPRTHLHICDTKSNEWQEKLLFRDYLLKHPERRKEYEQLKMKLAAKFKYDRSSYTEAKESFINETLCLAKTSGI